MRNISRRDFIKSTIGVSSAVFASVNGTSCTLKNKIPNDFKVFIPLPIQVVIDDVGWWSGEDGSQRQEPYRTGINRDHVPADYQAIVDLGASLGIRPQAAIILCEWDKENILRELPSSTWMGEQWDNSVRVGPWFEEAADIMRNNPQFFEITVHGIGHEYWENGVFTRAEWTDSNGQMRPEDQVEKHLEYFGKLMNQHNLGSFPTSFVPAAFRHSFGPSEGRDISLASILQKFGINYINTPFSSIYNKQRIQFPMFGFDGDVMTIDRGKDEFPWYTFPGKPSKEIIGPTYGMHWPNILHPNPDKNPEVVKEWVNFFRPYNDMSDKMLAPDSNYFQHQLAHFTTTKINIERNLVILDFTETDKLPANMGRGKLTLKILTSKPLKFKFNDIKIIDRSMKKDNNYLYVLQLEREKGKNKALIKIREY